MLVGHPVFWILAAAVVAPLLAEIPLGLKVPVVVLEAALGIVIGPHVLHLVQFDGFVETMFTIGMAVTLFMGGMELDFGEIKGRPLFLAVGGWIVSLALGVTVVGLLHAIPNVRAPLMVTLAMCTTGLGVLIPIFRDGGQLGTAFGRFVVATGTLGEVGPIVAMSLLLSQHYSTWQEGGFLVTFLLIVGIAIAVGVSARPPMVMEILRRHMNKSTQLPVRMSLLTLAALIWLAGNFGFENILGAFAAGMILGQATRDERGKALREKIETVSFAWFYPFFFVGTGIKFDIAALSRDRTTMLLVPTFAVLFLIVRGTPVFLYRGYLEKAQRFPFALSSAVPSLSIIVVIAEIGLRSKSMNPDVAAAVIGAAMLSVLLFPTIAGAFLSRTAVTAGQKPALPQTEKPPDCSELPPSKTPFKCV
jgi:Kef-type K+ transport system membrane component KefB